MYEIFTNQYVQENTMATGSEHVKMKNGKDKVDKNVTASLATSSKKKKKETNAAFQEDIQEKFKTYFEEKEYDGDLEEAVITAMISVKDAADKDTKDKNGTKTSFIEKAICGSGESVVKMAYPCYEKKQIEKNCKNDLDEMIDQGMSTMLTAGGERKTARRAQICEKSGAERMIIQKTLNNYIAIKNINELMEM